MQGTSQGKFIVLDGMDGSGKTTQMMNLVKYIFKKDKKNHIVLTREPYASDFGLEIRRLLAESTDPMKNGEKMAELFVGDRKVHIEKIISPSLAKGMHVLSDRFKYSTLAYQQTQGISLQKLIEMHKGLLAPDLALIFDIPAEIAIQRMSKDAIRGKTEVFEKLDFQEKLRRNYTELKNQLPNENIVIIDASKSINEVFEQIRKEVDKIL